MRSLETAIGLINETLQDTDFKSIDVESLKPEAGIIEEWERKVEEIDIRNFLFGVVASENTKTH